MINAGDYLNADVARTGDNSQAIMWGEMDDAQDDYDLHSRLQNHVGVSFVTRS